MRLFDLKNWLLTLGAVPLLASAAFVSPVWADRDDSDKDRKVFSHHDSHHHGGWKSRVVNCNKGGSIQRKIDRAESGDTVWVSGNCTENVTIDRDDITLAAHSNGASITAAVTTAPLVTIRGNRARIVGFTLVGGSSVILVTYGSSATIEANDISGGDTSRGIFVTQNSYAQIGGDDASKGNVIHHNRRGVDVNSSSSVDVFSNTFHNNERGIQIINSSAGRLGDNTISDSDRAVYVAFSSNLTLASGTSAATQGANTFINNTDAIRCRFGASFSGGPSAVEQIDGGNVNLINLSTGDATRCHFSDSVVFIAP